MNILKLLLLGAMTARLGEEPVSFRSSKVKALLAYLAVHADQPHTREMLATLLWGNQPDQKARVNLRSVLAQLRGSLGEVADVLLTVTPQTVQFNLVPDRVWVDVHEFSDLWQAVQAYPVSEWWRRAAAISRLQRLAGIYGGEFLAGLHPDDCPDFEDWRLLQGEQYHQQMLVALSALAEHELALALPMAAMTYARRQLALEPWREVAHRQLMQAHGMMGQPQLARQQYDVCCQILMEELGIEPGEETQALWAQMTGNGGRPFIQPAMHNHPTSATPFIGRRKTLTRLLPLLLDPDYRLLTLTGVGGVGKTRLALEIGAKMTSHFGDGVWFVPLVGVIENPDDADWVVETVASAVAQVLSVTLTGQGTAQTQLLAALKRKEMLLILDNFEHLQAGVSLVTALVAQCPAVKLLVTSRNRLNLQSETHVPLTGLPVGEVTQPAAAVELFQERAQRVDFSFMLGEGEQPLAIQLCQFLEGVPLSIELAAAWIDRQPLAEIVTTIAQDLKQMATTMADVPERQRSLRAVFAGSWRLLTETEQKTLAQLAVFRGGFQPEAVAGLDRTVLSNLVEHFLLRQGENDRYDLHELLRQFSFEKLMESGFLAEVQAGHGRYYLQFVAQREARIRQEWLAVHGEIVVELGNIRQAWDWATAVMDVDLLAAMLPGIYALYRSANLFREGEQVLGKTAHQVEVWLQQAIDVDTNLRRLVETLLNEHRIVIADFLNKLGRGKDVPVMMEMAVAQAVQLENVGQQAAAEVQWGIGLIGKGVFNEARTHLTQAQGLAETIQDESLLADCLVHLGLVAWYQGDYSLAREYCQGSLYLSLKIEDKRIQVPAYILLGLIAKGLNLFEEALKNNAAGLAVARELRDRHWEGVARNNWGSICEDMGDFEQAKRHYEQSLTIRQETGYLEGESSTLNNLGNVHRILGDLPLAQSCLQASLIIRQQMQDRNGEAWSLLNLGLVARWTGRVTEAVAYGEQAVAIWHDIEERMAEANALCALGTTLVNVGKYEQAEGYLLAALRLSEEMQNRRIEALARHNLGVLACERGEFEQARAYLQQALALRQALGKRRPVVESQAWLAWLVFMQGDDMAGAGYLDDVVEHMMTDKGAVSMERPFRVYFICCHLLRKLAPSQVNQLSLIACQHLHKQAMKFSIESERRAFLEDVPDHRLIREETACQERMMD